MEAAISNAGGDRLTTFQKSIHKEKPDNPLYGFPDNRNKQLHTDERCRTFEANNASDPNTYL